MIMGQNNNYYYIIIGYLIKYIYRFLTRYMERYQTLHQNLSALRLKHNIINDMITLIYLGIILCISIILFYNLQYYIRGRLFRGSWKSMYTRFPSNAWKLIEVCSHARQFDISILNLRGGWSRSRRCTWSPAVYS